MYADRDDAFAFFQRSPLHGALDVGDVGARGEQGNDYRGAVDGAFNLTAPDVACSQALNAKPDIGAFVGEVLVQPTCQVSAVFVGVGDEDAWLGGRWYARTDYHEGARRESQG